MVDDVRRTEEPVAGAAVVHRPVGEGTEVVRSDDGSYLVRGREVLRAVALSDLNDIDAMEYVQRRLRRLGVERALVRAGVREGDVVHLGQLTFTYHRDDPALLGSDMNDGEDEP
ncbi:MAG: Obg family GTPase CgtA [Acidimicrobiales bacterium]